jgi:hypothetical protein
MAWIVVDVEADGPCPVLYSMISFGAVIVEPGLGRSFKGLTAPVSEHWLPEVLAISGESRQQHLAYPPPEETMAAFAGWIAEQCPEGRATFVSDNPAFDWQFINYYLHRYVGTNPFGFSGRRIGDLYAGWKGDARKVGDWKDLRRTRHTHDPLDDAMGNAEALLAMREQGLKMPLGLDADGRAR